MAGKKKEITIRSSAAEYLTFIAATGDNRQSFEMRYEDENIWLTQKRMAVLYDVSVAAINQHIKNIFDDHELEPGSVIKKCKYLFATGSSGSSSSTVRKKAAASLLLPFFRASTPMLEMILTFSGSS